MMCFGLYIHSHTQRRHLACEILIVIEETMYDIDMDKNRDGKITLKEYISKHLSLM